MVPGGLETVAYRLIRKHLEGVKPAVAAGSIVAGGMSHLVQWISPTLFTAIELDTFFVLGSMLRRIQQVQ